MQASGMLNHGTASWHGIMPAVQARGMPVAASTVRQGPHLMAALNKGVQWGRCCRQQPSVTTCDCCYYPRSHNLMLSAAATCVCAVPPCPGALEQPLR
jgi:hypothetical protein